MNSMAAMFYTASILFYLKGRLSQKQEGHYSKTITALWFSGSFLTCILALGSKEIAATLPVFILLYEWVFFQDLNSNWLKARIPWVAGILIVLVIAALVYTNGHLLQGILSGYAIRPFTPLQRVMTEFRVVLFYISLLLFPHPARLNLDHDFAISYSLFNPTTTLFSMLAIFCILGLSFYLAKKERLISYCLLWFIGNLVIESSVIGLEIIFEHRLYLPSMLFLLVLVLLIYRYVKPWWLAVSIMSVMVIVCSIWTYQRNAVWHDDTTLWRDSVVKSPNKARPRHALGVNLKKQDRFAEAVFQFKEALRINPYYADVRNELAEILIGQGKYKEAAEHLNATLSINPRHSRAYNNLGSLMELQGKYTEATGNFLKAIEIEPAYAQAHYNLGVVYHRQGKLKQAQEEYMKALGADPGFAKAHNNLGVAMQQQGKLKEAVKHFSTALKLEPGYKEARRNLESARRVEN
jgi:tetratricopeptide (TPR) repeat protein